MATHVFSGAASTLSAYPPGILLTADVCDRLMKAQFCCRNACYGSAEVSFPAVLPYIAKMPKDLLGPDPSVISQLLASIWHGWEVAGTQGAARAAAADSYVECLAWTFAKSPDVSDLPALPTSSRLPMHRILITNLDVTCRAKEQKAQHSHMLRHGHTLAERAVAEPQEHHVCQVSTPCKHRCCPVIHQETTADC